MDAQTGISNDRDEPIYTVSVAAELAGMHAQTLRQYDRLGLVRPERTKGRGRRYSGGDVRRLREIQAMTQDQGINLAGVALILELREHVSRLSEEVEHLRLVISRTSVPTSRVFTADASGDVRLRAPAPEASADPGRLSPMDDQVTRAVVTPGKSMVPASQTLGWQRMAQLHLARRMQQRAAQTPKKS